MPPDAARFVLPTVKGQIVRLRAVTRDDLPILRCWRSDPATWALTMGYRGPIMEPGDEAWYQNVATSTHAVVFAAARHDDTAVIGLVQLTDIDHVSGTAELGIQLDPSARGKGAGTEALALIIDYARDALNLRKLTLRVVAYNAAARSMYERAGFEVEGTLRAHYFLSGEYHDVVLMSLMLSH